MPSETASVAPEPVPAQTEDAALWWNQDGAEEARAAVRAELLDGLNALEVRCDVIKTDGEMIGETAHAGKRHC